MRRGVSAGLLALALNGCASSTSPVTTAPAPTSTAPASTGTQTDTIPPGIVAAMPFQNRLDVAKGIFQLKVFNGTDEPIEIVGARLVWDGLTTPVANRHNVVLPGGRVDFPVPLAPATCVGDGDDASMPDVGGAVAELHLVDGSTRDVPVFDVKRFARRLYLDDCERQRIESLVAIEWVDLHEVTVDGRPVTEGSLRLTRRASTDDVAVRDVSNTINFTVTPVAPGSAVTLDLAAGEQTASVPVRFIEGRCDAHALSESSQPFAFVARVDLGDGVDRTFTVTPPGPDRVPMRTRVERACAILDEIEFVGEG